MTNEKPTETPWQWRDLHWFLAINRAPNLRKAAELCNVSAATLSRRIRALEHDLKVDIFIRDSSGYTLTPYGQQVLYIVERMDLVASEIVQLPATGKPVVRIAAGSWMSQFLAKNITFIQRPEDVFSQEWVTGVEKVDVVRRNAHIGIRNSRPQEEGLAGRKLVAVAFCVYRQRGSSLDKTSDWIVVQGDVTPSSRWATEQAANSVIKVSEPTLVLPIVLAGEGRAVLPCFIGDSEHRLERCGQVIESLTHDQWLVVNNNDRYLNEVRVTLDRIVKMIKKRKNLFAGNEGYSGSD